jgi:soluble lytic murein transglycosylase
MMKKLIFFLLFIALLGGVAYYLMDMLFPLKYEEYVKEASEKYNIEEALIYSIIKTESNFKSSAMSHKDAQGLMQLLPSTAEWIAKREKVKKYDLHDPRDNIMLGTAYFSYLLQKTDGDVEKAWIAYNAGIGRLKDEKWRQIEETTKYVQKLNLVYPIYKFRLKYKI